MSVSYPRSSTVRPTTRGSHLRSASCRSPLTASFSSFCILFVLPGSVLQLRSERNAPVVREKRSAFRELTEALLYSILIT
ncbi:MAG: DUF6338 family protein, partial [Candidatus Limnocylindria bacterium]